MFFSDLHVQILARGLLQPGETLVGQTVTRYAPLWAFGFIRRQYLVLATNQRLILVAHRYKFLQPLEQELHQVDSIAWSNVQELKVKGLLFKKKLRVRGLGDRGPVALTMPIPGGFLAPMRDNVKSARALEAASPGRPNLLPAAHPQAYGAPPTYARPSLPIPAQNSPGYASVPPMPVQNAPGYSSVPPPPVHYAPNQTTQASTPPPPWPGQQGPRSWS